jgi:hypothetical protein
LPVGENLTQSRGGAETQKNRERSEVIVADNTSLRFFAPWRRCAFAFQTLQQAVNAYAPRHTRAAPEAILPQRAAANVG